MIQVERKNEYHCEKHDFRSTDPKAVLKHIKGDMVDVTMEPVAKVVKAQMGLDP